MRRRQLLHEGRRLQLPEGVPSDARFVQHVANEACVQGEVFYGGRRAQIAWSPDGRILSERYFDGDGRARGLEVSRFETGEVEWQVPWRQGQMHGFARQFDERGAELSRSRFVNGAGLDVWIVGDRVVEVRQLRASTPNGLERWGHPRFPYEEGHYIDGKRAGVFRRWVGQALESGYPKYLLDDIEVSRARYQQARAKNRRLPADSREDDVRNRSAPKALKAVWLRKDIRAAADALPGPGDRVCGEP